MKSTLLETNMAPENQWEDEIPYWGRSISLFSRSAFKGDFQGV